ncbi:MAG: Rare lipoprotein A precursor [uncultured Thiotrichaceae bacterium]|uniref:Endolytic peptidoglycan transglycosylase RlpA n=1 Tax=uncultured Thiotrichaceae bacterium TaxID=298394 RepID=A0A6S6SC75_9GAMM|nr:MAG: Rare lipoprotein A precursor [uncultured Thiotrichaceae bacterium]
MMKTLLQKSILGVACGLLVLLSGCGMIGGKDKSLPETVLATPPLKMMPRVAGGGTGSCGNEPTYTLNGKSYRVLSSAAGYREEGVASWYGAEFQGSDTAGCETFDMNGFTAAHRTLPLPSIVRVRNLQNGKSVIVRVNDRGPFDSNGLIQLSFAAANTLGMTKGSRVAKVSVEALSGKAASVSAQAPGRPALRPASVRQVKKPSPGQVAAIQQAKRSGKSFFVVVKNYREQSEALDMFIRLTSVGLNKTEMASAMSRGQKMHQVRIGPLYTQDQIDNVRDSLESNGLATFKVVEIK